MEGLIPIILTICLIQLLFITFICVGISNTFKKRMDKFEEKMVGMDAGKIKEHQNKIEKLYSKINQNYYKVEKNQADLIDKIKQFTENRNDYSSVKSHVVSTNNQLDFLEIKLDDLLSGMRTLKDRKERENSEVSDSNLIDIKNVLLGMEKEMHKIVMKDNQVEAEELIGIKDLIRKLSQDINNIKNDVGVRSEKENGEIYQQQQKVRTGLVNNLKSLFEDTNSLKDVMFSKDSTWNEKQINEMFSNLIKTISEMEQKIVTDLYNQNRNSTALNKNYQNIEENILEIHRMIKQLQTSRIEDSNKVKRELENILSHVSPLQSNVMNNLLQSINELKDIKKDLHITDTNKAEYNLSADIMLIQESLDALSEYLNVSQKQLLNVLSHNNEKLNIVDEKFEKSFDDFQNNLKVSENKLVNYLSFVYQSMTSNSNNNSIEIGIISKIDQLRNKIDAQSEESKKYFSTLYKKLSEPGEKD